MKERTQGYVTLQALRKKNKKRALWKMTQGGFAYVCPMEEQENNV